MTYCNRIVFMLAVLILSAGLVGAQTVRLPRTGQTVCYDESGDEAACTGTGQDGEYKMGVPWEVHLPGGAHRFTTGGTCITDRLTDLTWTTDANLAGGPMTWEEALEWVKGIDTCSTVDWRLPNVNEIESLVHSGEASSLWLESLGFTNVAGHDFWSSTTNVDNAQRAWAVNMASGSLFSPLKSSDNYYVWPVRGTSGPPAELWKTGQTDCYNAAGGVIDCAGTGQDGNFQEGATWPASRFTDHGNGTVTDELTGLMWTKDANAPGPSACYPGGYKPWHGTYTHIQCMNDRSYLGYNNWRLPNRKELRSLVDYSRSSPALPPGHPFLNVQTDYEYRSSTGVAYLTGSAYSWVVSIDTGDISTGWNGHGYYIWPVRGGPRYYGVHIVKQGAGTGLITSIPSGIDCGATCSAEFIEGRVITLTASPSEGSTFSGWSGAGCSGTGDCVITIPANTTTVEATFDLDATLEGTIGTQFTINGLGFGTKKGKVTIGNVATKVTYWDGLHVQCTVKKVPLPPISYELSVLPKKPLQKITAGTFAVRTPSLNPLSIDRGLPDTKILITGKFFGTKKGKVYLEDGVGNKKACKVEEWSMYDTINGDSRIIFVVPKPSNVFVPGTYTLKVINKVGFGQTTFTIESP